MLTLRVKIVLRQAQLATAHGLWLAGLLFSTAVISSAQSITVTQYPIPTSNSVPEGITTGPDGALWFTEYGYSGGGGNKIGRITTDGVVTNEYPVPTSQSGDEEITAGPDGALWFGETIADQVGRVTTSGAFTEYPTPAPFHGNPFGITAGSDGALWFCEFSVRQIGRITTTGLITEYVLPTQGAAPLTITSGPDGALWFTEDGGNNIGRITTDGSITEYPLPTPGSTPEGITVGPDGALWFTESGIGSGISKIGRITTGGTINEFPVPTYFGASYGNSRITLGSDGALWFTEPITMPNIGRITTDGLITEYPLQWGSGLHGITQGPDGAIWFTEVGENAIARAVFASAVTITTTTLPNGVTNAAYPGTTLHASGGTTPYSWSATGLPTGLSLDASSGVLSGTPTVAGTFNTTVAVTDSSIPNQTAQQTYSIVISTPPPPPPGVAVSPASLTFGNQVINATSAARRVFLTSTGITDLNFLGVTFSGANAGDFAQTNNCPASIPPGGKCGLSVTFTPSILGAESATLDVNDNVSNSPQTVALSGGGLSPSALAPTSANFGNVAIDTPSAAKAFTLKNAQSVTLSISSVMFTGANAGDFSQTNTCGSSLAVRASCTISVTLTPSVLGTETATLTIDDGAPAPYNVVTSSLAGTGVQQAGVRPTSATFPTQSVGTTGAPGSVTLKNNLPTALTISSITFTGADPGDFAQTNTCGGSLAAQSTCTISVTFTPSATGTRAATLNVYDSANNSPQTVSLTGMGK